MGQYINKSSKRPLGAFGKAKTLVEDGDATIIDMPDIWQEGIVCVVENGFFEAAGYAYSTRELVAFQTPDGRPRTWLLCPKAKDLVD